jgi:hypothetical protein
MGTREARHLPGSKEGNGRIPAELRTPGNVPGQEKRNNSPVFQVQGFWQDLRCNEDNFREVSVGKNGIIFSIFLRDARFRSGP